MINVFCIFSTTAASSCMESTITVARFSLPGCVFLLILILIPCDHWNLDVSQTPDIWLYLLVQQTGTNTFINGGLLAAVNAIGTHLRDQINSGLTRRCMMLDAAAELRRNPVSKDQIA